MIVYNVESTSKNFNETFAQKCKHFCFFIVFHLKTMVLLQRTSCKNFRHLPQLEVGKLAPLERYIVADSNA